MGSVILYKKYSQLLKEKQRTVEILQLLTDLNATPPEFDYHLAQLGIITKHIDKRHQQYNINYPAFLPNPVNLF